MSPAATGEEMRVGRQTVRITRPQKLLFPDDGLDKRQLADIRPQAPRLDADVVNR